MRHSFQTSEVTWHHSSTPERLHIVYWWENIHEMASGINGPQPFWIFKTISMWHKSTLTAFRCYCSQFNRRIIFQWPTGKLLWYWSVALNWTGFDSAQLVIPTTDHFHLSCFWNKVQLRPVKVRSTTLSFFQNESSSRSVQWSGWSPNHQPALSNLKRRFSNSKVEPCVSETCVNIPFILETHFLYTFLDGSSKTTLRQLVREKILK